MSLLSRLSNTQGINIQILGTTTVLVIANVTEEDYGNYTCVASNRLGVQNASLFLYSEYRNNCYSLRFTTEIPNGRLLGFIDHIQCHRCDCGCCRDFICYADEVLTITYHAKYRLYAMFEQSIIQITEFQGETG